MREDIWNIGLQGGVGRGMEGLWTGSSVMRRRRWRRRDLEEVAQVEEELGNRKPAPERAPIPSPSPSPTSAPRPPESHP